MVETNGFYIKPWEELTFTDDYMFKLILRKHEDICRRILETILDVKIGRIEYLETEKVSEPGYEGHGVRFDVYPLISYINNREIQDDLTQSLDNVIEYEKRFEKERVGYMNLKLTLSEERAYGYDMGFEDGESRGKLDALRSMLAAGLTTLTAVQQSGLYTPEELAAIQDMK